MDLHIFFLPFLAPGHMIPMIDLARLLADRGAKATIITTTENIPLIRPTIDLANSSRHRQIELLAIPFPYSESGVLEGHENLTTFPNPDVTPEFYTAINMLEAPFAQLAKDHHPDCIISDIFYPWSASLAHDLGIPRLIFNGTGFFCNVVVGAVGRLKPHENVTSDEQAFVVPEVPHRIEMTRSQLPDFITGASTYFLKQLGDSHRFNYGMIVNSFYEMEHDYIDEFKERANIKIWHVGPVSLRNQDLHDKLVRGDKASVDCDRCLSWLDAKKPGSVLYICFGSLGRFTRTQLCEIASGLEASEHPFIWVVRCGGELSEWLPEGFEERVIRKGRALIISGWAPQLLILNHEAVGGFVTHCGWNSCMEGASAGLPMITWPLFAEQFFNEKLIVDVLRIGIAIGVKVCCSKEEERMMVGREDIRRAVNELMGNGEEADGRRERASGLGKMARRAVEEGGSSYNEMSRLIEDLLNLKAGKIQSSKVGE
ncbi:scopoletin glucosyltransferase [Elaeis guineensis]|uniref:Glycosyltransferase n=1 Tax=Elaeis guineensis var. tenera TaxID=51953 RepID=A0A6I9RGM0_ELAGV|nr:scopoletin glucosyltransferase [Elaeis guineensis]